ncbi:MAG: hypothetical protein IK127_08475 [Clostridia bacterium]|nr:hypothetical protein [Clostridia bacterium]
MNEAMPLDPILDTGDVSPLLLPWQRDPFGILRPPPDSRVFRLAAAMASAVYALELEPFLATGWQDACAQLGPDITDGLNLSGEYGSLNGLRQARKKLQSHPLRRGLASGIREWRNGSGVKTLAMLRRIPDGRFIVAVSFMGSVRLEDWMANFDMMNEDGLHRGFLRRTLAFEEAEDAIDFPQAAEQLGLKRLTLRTVIEACARPDSPFRLFLTGHSLGAAVMQIYVHRLLTRRNVLPELVQGVGFASPKVACGDAIEHPGDWPMCHILNGDDCIPRIGSEVHLGLCLRYPSDDNLRELCYAFTADEAARNARTLVLPVFRLMRDTPSAIAACCGILQVYMDATPVDILPALNRLNSEWALVQRLLSAGDSQADRLIRFIIRHAEAFCVSVSGHGTDPAIAQEAKSGFAAAAEVLGLQGAMNALMQLEAAAHTMRTENGQAVYPWLAQRALTSFAPFIWEPGRPPTEQIGRWSE